MVTIYDLLEVSEDATKEEIEKAYTEMLTQYAVSPNNTEKENKENEFILNKLKMAYEILTNDEKRKKYDKNLAQKRAEDLIKNVTVKEETNEEGSEVVRPEPVKTEVIRPQVNNTIKKNVSAEEQRIKNEKYDKEFDDSIDEGLTEEEQERLRKAAQEEFNRNLQRAKQAEKEYNEAYTKAYNEYMKKSNKEKRTGLLMAKLKKVKITLIVIISIIVVCAIAWHIPPVKNSIVDLYNTNTIFRVIANIFLTIFDVIIGIFKK